MPEAAERSVKPERFGRYVLLDRIGAGGMAEVFRAIMPGAEGFRRTLVVKRILGQLSQTPSFVDMFVQEARICSLLNHRSIVAVYDFGQVDGNYFLAMEYVRGRDLHAVVRQLRNTGRACPIPVAAFVAREVADCLGYAHDLADSERKPLNIIHRDVSPSNIMCLSTGGVKLLDFGIAKALGEAPENRTERGSFKGKLSYMAPERLRRESVDRRSDLFSLGVVLWELLTGRRLFRGASDDETIRNVLQTSVPAPSALRADVPAALDAVVMRALERDPARRYSGGQEMVDDLEEVLQAVQHQSKMLPALMRELFGAGLTTGQIVLGGLEEELAAIAESSTARGTVTPPAVEPTSAGQTWKRLAAGTLAVGMSAALGMLLFARGGGGRSHAMGLPGQASPVGQAAPKKEPPVVAAPPAAPAEAPPAEPVEIARVPEAAEAAAPAAESESETTSRRSRSRRRAERDRIARGLSIDPFADTSRGRK